MQCLINIIGHSLQAPGQPVCYCCSSSSSNIEQQNLMSMLLMLTELMLTEQGAKDSAVLMLLPLHSEVARLWYSVLSLG